MSAENNGGRTGYYDLPLPDKAELKRILLDFHNGQGLTTDVESTITKIVSLSPQTLNDLIEYKEMSPWQHEVFKATYAIKERAKRGKFASTVREINKIIYYAGRGLAIAMREQK